MFDPQPPFLNEDEVKRHRMATFHRERVAAIAAGESPMGKRDDGVLVIHLLPESCVVSPQRFDASTLKEHGRISPLGDSGYNSRFNVDGFMNFSGVDQARAYSQLFRDGSLEAAMSNVSFRDRTPDGQAGPQVIRDSICESATFQCVGAYLSFCKALDVSTPIGIYSALVRCDGARICTHWGFHDLNEHAVDRSPCYLPPLEVGSLEVDPKVVLRPWCDTFWQACGMEKSYSFDDDGNWHQRR